MNKMKIPGFTAEVSLYKPSESYNIAGADGQAIDAIQLAWGIDCLPMCLIRARRRCHQMCPPHSIDCLPMCMIISEGRCHRMCQGGIQMLSPTLPLPPPAEY
jgi:hypothetical protein